MQELEALLEKSAKESVNKFLLNLEPPPQESIPEWIEKYRELPANAAGSGKMSISKTEYMRYPLECATNPKVRGICIMAGSQISKTEFCLNVLGRFIHRDPCNVLMTFPSGNFVDSFSKDRFATMIRSTKVLNELVYDAKSRDSSNTIKHKNFSGGSVYLGTCSANDVCGRAVRIFFSDEVDRYPDSAGGTEGNVIALGQERMNTFSHTSLFIATSTPLDVETSKIYKIYSEYKRHKYLVPCYECSEFIEIDWGQYECEGNNFESTRYVCQICEKRLQDYQMIKMVKEGKWIDLDPDKSDAYLSFHVSGLLSPWVPMKSHMQKYLSAVGDPHKMQVFENTSLGIPYERKNENVEDIELMGRREDWKDLVPSSVLLVTLAIDIQQDRAELLWLGWGEGKKSYAIHHQKMFGNPESRKFWSDLDCELKRTFETEQGFLVKADAVAIDTGGGSKTWVSNVGSWLTMHKGERVFGIKGAGGFHRDIFKLSKRRKSVNRRSYDLYILAVDILKSMVYHRLAIKDPSQPGHCSFPTADWCNKEFFKQLTAEILKTVYVKGYAKKVWEKPDHRANEILDLYAYSTFLCEILNPNFSALQQRQQKRMENKKSSKSTSKKLMQKAGISSAKSGFVNSWR